MTRTPLRSVLATVDYPDDAMAELIRIFAPAPVALVARDDDDGIAAALQHADAAVLAKDLDPRFLAAPRLRWVHCDQSGLDRSAAPELFERTDLVVTSSAGRNAPALAQHVFYFALALAYEAPRLLEAQQAHRWTGFADYRDPWALWGKTMGIVGLGETGKDVAQMARAFGMRTLAYGRSGADAGAHVDTFLSAAEAGSLSELLTQSDFVVLTIRLSDETHHLIGPDELALMKPTAHLINVARGSVVDEAALVDALVAGTIRGAGLDVFEQEPLPADAAVWDAPNVLITPHTTLRMRDMIDRTLAIIRDNHERYRDGRPLVNVLTRSDVYSR
ncbi:D-2-hydroxyacid dehydrogenase [Microlunatus flavus]|uniref:Phosphoglycerate dehydrogenase n=1 Tax=Microlunatus flavus TaxID=1036181 RepID=A0A1H9A867_9ACTN|nr:D-2-hydroxyacid dehydrogenase [Microlunatus flavus]SEP72825.1 Phosphoglycerate dehydrogenase [Microlunatus flavus]